MTKKTTTSIREENGWLIDSDNNRASIAHFGSEKAAREALESLTDCRDCTNCSDCTYCSYCSDCTNCSDCAGCTYCSYCTYCAGCTNCSDCSYCTNCSDCAGCSGKAGEKGDFTPPETPKIENIHKRVFQAASQPDALDMGDWHTCNTTHCRAGWVVHLAGEAGYAIERFHNTQLAAQLIYKASGYEINPGRFFDSNEDAMADMRRLAKGGEA